MRDLPRLLESGSLEDRKDLVRVFVAGAKVVPDEMRLDLQIRQLPALWPGDSSVGVVAGARYEPVQKSLDPAQRFLAGGGS